MRKCYLTWANFTLADHMKPAGLRDLRDLLRTENLVNLAEICCRESIPGTVANPSVQQHDRNIEAVIAHLATKTEIEWGARKLTLQVQAKQLGFVELLLWHLFEVGEVCVFVDLEGFFFFFFYFGFVLQAHSFGTSSWCKHLVRADGGD